MTRLDWQPGDESLQELAARDAVFVVNHSGGKDSQAMLIRLLHLLPATQLVVAHADLSEVEWAGTMDHAAKQARDAGVEFVVARSSTKTLLSMVENRFVTRPSVPSWPSADTRQCTSDLKRGPLEREIRAMLQRRGKKLLVSCMGMRAQESARRAKAVVLKKNAGQSIAGREWWEWLPIHTWKVDEVLDTIREAGQQPHPAYLAGNERLSCVFCILGSANDARVGALYNPELFERYVEIEKRTGYTSHMDRRGLEQIAGLTVAEAYAQRRSLPVVAGG